MTEHVQPAGSFRVITAEEFLALPEEELPPPDDEELWRSPSRREAQRTGASASGTESTSRRSLAAPKHDERRKRSERARPAARPAEEQRQALAQRPLRTTMGSQGRRRSHGRRHRLPRRPRAPSRPRARRSHRRACLRGQGAEGSIMTPCHPRGPCQHSRPSWKPRRAESSEPPRPQAAGSRSAAALPPHDPGPPVRERCAFCSFEASAPLEQARAAFAQHECERPRPEPRPKRRPGSPVIF